MTGEPSGVSGRGRGFSDIGVDPDLVVLTSFPAINTVVLLPHPF
jgi:hypothetical protein